MGKIRKFIRLSSAEKHMVMEALWYSARYRYLLLHKPFRTFADDLGQKKDPGFEMPLILGEYPNEKKEMITRLAWIVNKVCDATPWKSECLVRAFAAKRMLLKREIPCIVYMGVAQSDDGKMLAHAWTKIESMFLTGEAGHESFTVTACFYS